MTESAAGTPNPESGAANTAISEKKSSAKKKRGAGYKFGTVGLMVITGIIAFIAVATIVGGLQQLAVESCSRANGLSCSIPAAGDVPWIEFAVGLVCLGLLWFLLRKR